MRSGPPVIGALLAVLVLGACADDAPPRGPVPVGEAADGEGPVVVEGRLLLVEVPATPPRLCSGLTDHVPPRCEEPSVRVEGLSGELPPMDATPDGTHLWSRARVSIRGSMSDGVLHVSEPPQPLER